ncbi:hypothetical protein [Liquorilactobacillus oeni]|uniref:Two-component sensor histidine kinase n=1 Tax=Liquorilactobacillus oeni DSM 19972 TaxID=1423777 RepID=A0A0R1M792_9LACO|nr:hypothetical protein [Liquorilactobacillus oeni]KRL03982.1 hypothetical protein FD46_GL000149 [Liquorilactobacillus oeni DSM 19972]
MKDSKKAYLIFSGTTLIVIMGLVFGGQLFYYHERLATLSDTVHYNTALILRNLAISNDIQQGKVIDYQQGSVIRENDAFIVKLDTGFEIKLDTAHY